MSTNPIDSWLFTSHAHATSPRTIPPILREICDRLIAERRDDELLPWIDRALAIDPGEREFIEMRVHALSLLGRHREAADMLRREAHHPWQRSAFESRLGHLEAGWRLAREQGDAHGAILAEHRLGEAWLKRGAPRGFAHWIRRIEDPASSGCYRPAGLPQWDGAADPGGRRILITHQLGFGDQLLMYAAARDWLHAGARLMITCDAPLVPVLEASLPDCEVLALPRPLHPGEPLPYALAPAIRRFAPNLHAIMLHLPLLDARRAAPRARFEPYLRAPPRQAREAALWARRMSAATPERIRVGLFHDCVQRHHPEVGAPMRCWAARHSLPPAFVDALLAHPALRSRVQFVSLHPPQADALAGGPRRGLRHYAPDIRDFGDTAACIRELDAVVAVDSAVSNLAALLGTPTCVPLNTSGDWRWGHEGSTSPWLPGVHVLRQPRLEHWQPLLEPLVGWLTKIATPPAR